MNIKIILVYLTKLTLQSLVHTCQCSLVGRLQKLDNYHHGALLFCVYVLSLYSGKHLQWEEVPVARRALELRQDLSHLTGSSWGVINKGAAWLC